MSNVHPVVDLVGLLPAQVPRHARPAQHRAGEAQRHRALRRDHADADGALLPDPVLGEQRLVVVDVAGEAAREVVDEIEQRPLPVLVHRRERARVARVLRRVLRHPVRQVAVDAARAVVGGMHARAGDRLVHVEQVLALAERVEERRHAADVERVRAEPQQVVEHARDLVEHHADVLRADRHLDAQQSLDREAIGVLVAHHRHVVEPVHVGKRLDPGAGLGELLGRAVQQADVRVGALDHLAVELEHQAQHAVRRRVLRARSSSCSCGSRPCATRCPRSGSRAPRAA